MKIQGLHHITLVSADAQRTVDFYVGVLGLRLVKKTVNFDDPSAYHLYFGDQVGSPGSAITFFEWPRAPRGRPGIGGTHHLALTVNDYDGLLKWKRRLTDLGVAVRGPYDRHYFQSLYFSDPDGVILEIATKSPGMSIDETIETLGTQRLSPPESMVAANRDEDRIAALTWPEAVPMITPDMALVQGMHHISAISSNIEKTHEFLNGVLGLKLVKMTTNFDDPNAAHWYWGDAEGKPGTLITYFEHDPRHRRYHYVQMGAGQTHHWALAVPDDASQLYFREKLVEAGVRVSEVAERYYFRSIYSRDPDGHIVELATAGPGFLIDEPIETLGQGLMLPEWLEPHRADIERTLTPLIIPDIRIAEGK